MLGLSMSEGPLLLVPLPRGERLGEADSTDSLIGHPHLCGELVEPLAVPTKEEEVALQAP
jgi:hypothetical protein